MRDGVKALDQIQQSNGVFSAGPGSQLCTRSLLPRGDVSALGYAREEERPLMGSLPRSCDRHPDGHPKPYDPWAETDGTEATICPGEHRNSNDPHGQRPFTKKFADDEDAKQRD